MQFGKDFLIGGATSDFQFEGGCFEDGKGLSTHDYETNGNLENPRSVIYIDKDGNKAKARSSFLNPDSIPDGAKIIIDKDSYYPSHNGVDHYHHMKEDIDLMAEMGFNVYRFAICWSRIFPTGEEEKPNELGLKFYDDLIDYML